MPSRRAVVLLAITLCLVSLAGTSNAAASAATPQNVERSSSNSIRKPAKRSYDTHSYYVMELSEGSDELEAQMLAGVLGAELVEQVGELRDHWLVRAPFELQKRDSSTSSDEHDSVMQKYYSLAVDQQHDMRHAQPMHWIQQYATSKEVTQQEKHSSHNRREILHSRSVSPKNIVSLEKQVLKKRVKRDFPVELLEKRSPSWLQHRRDTPNSGNGGISQMLRDIAERFSIADPLWPKQWHLANDKMPENSINVTGVWDQGITGAGVRVAIVDDGLDMYSGDLKDNFYAEGSWDYNDHTDLPKPRLSDDQHGTRCAGEIAAAKNDVCGVGVAYNAQVAGIRILSASISDADEASALNFGYQENDIYSCSWGPPDDGKSMEAPSPLIYKSMLNGVQNGRGGKGSIFVFASGNGGAVDDQCNFDGYTNSIFSITISAIDRKGLHPYYSEGCSANMVVTYSSGSGDNIHTTDVGKNRCTDHHGGTSAAAPIAAGIFALVLEVRPELTWRDLQHMCVQTAIQVNLKDPDWQMTHAGRPFNHKYGYGKLDAYRLVELAKTFEPVRPQAWFQVAAQLVNKPMTKDGVSSKITVSRADLDVMNFDTLEHITVTVDAEHQRRGNMEVILESPNGIRSILARPRRFDNDPDGFPNWTFMSVKHWDEDPIGDWTLTMRDRQTNGKNGTFISWSMTLWGQSKDASLAKPYKMKNDDQIILPAPPHHKVEGNTTVTTITHVDGTSTWTETTTLALHAALPTTKSFLKPTAHLPDDHGQATGESDLPLEDEVPQKTNVPTSTSSSESTKPTSPSAQEDEAAEDDSYLGPWKSLVGDSTWFYIALGSVIIFLGAAGAYFLHRRRLARSGALGGGGRGRGGPFGGLFSGYGLLSGRDDDDTLPMSALERGTGGRPTTRSRALYDAFALEDSSEDESEFGGEEGKSLVGGGARSSTTGQQQESRSLSQREERFDDSYMSGFLEDDDDEDEDAKGSREGRATGQGGFRDDVDDDDNDYHDNKAEQSEDAPRTSTPPNLLEQTEDDERQSQRPSKDSFSP
ncbi:hypothetical protein P389DRAFT_173492 [Cystobasidium minutum MCA 4210]|uniref:uncharacterized protein n=1 Tax=Cystobasidium minutum MCA 4210 TaxID=1397322 RepID=UPI0034CEE567|eukprot:jgi/Rhomi1/173492/fgenesh1_kg.6_\